MGEHVQHAGNEGGTEEAGLFGERVFHGDGLLPFFGEEVGVGVRGEGAGDGFAVAEGEEAGADGGFFCCGRVGDDGDRSGEGVGEAVVAVDTGHLFDEVDLALEVETPGGELDLELVSGVGGRHTPGLKPPLLGA